MSIIFWDIPSTVGAWSYNTWKVRYCLNLKKIPYRTEWIEYPDIAAHCEKLGIPKTSAKSPFYTLPAIYDPSTGVYLADSPVIAEYLEKQYPDAPHIFPHNTIGLQIDFESRIDAKLADLWNFVIPRVCDILNPESKVYFRETREKSYKKKLEEIEPTGDLRTEKWKRIDKGFEDLAALHVKKRDLGPFILGTEVSWADFVMGAHLMWFKKAWGEEDAMWKAVITANDGVWKALCDALEEYETIN